MLRLNDFNLFLKIKMWRNRKGENVVRKECDQTQWKEATIQCLSLLLPPAQVAGICLCSPLGMPCTQLVRLRFIINYQGGQFYWLRNFYSHKLSVHFGLSTFHRVLSTSHPLSSSSPVFACAFPPLSSFLIFSLFFLVLIPRTWYL